MEKLYYISLKDDGFEVKAESKEKALEIAMRNISKEVEVDDGFSFERILDGYTEEENIEYLKEMKYYE